MAAQTAGRRGVSVARQWLELTVLLLTTQFRGNRSNRGRDKRDPVVQIGAEVNQVIKAFWCLADE